MTSVRDRQEAKAYSSTNSTLAGISILRILVPANALSPNYCKLDLGSNMTQKKQSHEPKKSRPIIFTSEATLAK
jgi:hypothetical protein